MNPYMTQTPNANDVALVESIVSQRLKGSILWMVVGLLTTLGIGVATLMNPSWARFAASNFNILLIVELAVVFLFSMRTYTANVMSLYAMFFIYSALNGVTLSLVSYAYGIMDAAVPALIGALAFFRGFFYCWSYNKEKSIWLRTLFASRCIWYDYCESRVHGCFLFLHSIS